MSHNPELIILLTFKWFQVLYGAVELLYPGHSTGTVEYTGCISVVGLFYSLS